MEGGGGKVEKNKKSIYSNCKKPMSDFEELMPKDYHSRLKAT